jgi:hypothetical protein
MAVVQTVVIPEAQMKVRWRETYVSEGINKALAVLDPGIYRGGYVMAQGTPNKTVKITPNGEQDSFYLWVEKTGGAALAVRYATDVTVDLSGEFTGGGGTMPSTKTYYVYMTGTYATGAPTSGAFYVDTTAPSTSGNAVRLAKITIPSGATTILDSYINLSTSATPASCYRMTASLDRVVVKRVELEFAAPSGTPPVFQILGKVYFPGGGASWMVRSSYVKLASTQASLLHQNPYIGDDRGRITVENFYADSGATVWATADSEGFMTNPWVKLDLTQTSDTSPPAGAAWYWTRATVRDLVTSDHFLEEFDVFPHAAEIITRDVAGTPTSLTAKNVSTAIEALVDAVNDRIPKVVTEAFNLFSDAAFMRGNFEPGTGGNDACCLLWQGGGSAAIKSRVYFGAAGKLMMTTNARWNQGTSKWVPDDDAVDAKMLLMDTTKGFQMCHKSTLTVGFATGWAIEAWDTMVTWLEYTGWFDLSPTVVGSNMGEAVPLGFGWWNKTGTNTDNILFSAVHRTFRGDVDTITYFVSNQSRMSCMPATVVTPTAIGALANIETDVVPNTMTAYWHGIAYVSYL